MARFLLILLLVLAIAVPNCTGGGEGEGGPMARGGQGTGALEGRSLVVVVADSLHARHLSAYSYARETSPYLDSLARGGVRMERALSQTSWTLSSITSLFTGLVQEVHGVLTPEQRLPDDGPPTLAESFQRAGYRTVGLVQNAVVGPHTGLGRGFDRYRSVTFDAEGTEELLEIAGAEVAATDDGPPLLLYVHFGPPHMPYAPPEPFRSAFVDPALQSDVTGSIRDCTEITVAALAPDHPDVQRLVALYDGHVRYADDLLRRVTEPCLTGERAERFAVLFTSDHGEAFMQHGAVGHNSFCYEPMVRIPWVIAAPGALPEGRVVPGPTSILDTLPTLLELFDLPIARGDLDGVSLASDLFRDASASGAPRELYLSSRYPRDGKAAQFALVEGPWKLVSRRRGKPPALFDMRDDPDELVDLARRLPERAEEMALRLAERRAAFARRRGEFEAEEAPLTRTLLRDLESLGYGGADFDSIGGR
ncbi:MAG: sulfatase [Planctomycetota bacterium]